MVILYYLYLLAPFVALFALGYFPVVWLGRLLTKQRPIEPGDRYAPFTGMLGTMVGFLYFGLRGIDRFAMVPEQVRAVWQSAGFALEIVQPLVSGGLCALSLLLLTRWIPALGQSRATSPVLALLVSFLNFACWTVLVSPFL